ncbi:right-handed parallel beta-helix repeat-containing protein [Desulfocastanea catecholica]
MKEKVINNRGIPFSTSLLLVFIMIMAFTVRGQAANLPGLSVTGVAPDGTESSVPAYRWLVEQDKTYHVQTDGSGAAIPTAFDPNWDQGNDGHPGGETLAVGFHQSYMPVVGKGCVGFDDLIAPDFVCNEVGITTLQPNTHYYVSVVPRSGASIGGASFKTDNSGNIPPTTVFVNQYPIETAQITILIFHDNAPINNAPDLPTEEPGTGPGQTDMSGFQILVEDAGGRYGASAGVQSQDAFGNPLGTTYNPDGTIAGFSPLITGPDGRLTIKNLAPGKYGIQAVPPAGQNWQQTATIEGTKVIDAWVKAGEPPFFAEFGPPGYHVFIGFVQPFNNIPGGGGATISGTVVNQHMSRPPDYAFYNGACFGHTTPWIGLNDMAVGIGTGIYAAATGPDCSFSIPSVPDGNYQVVVWDSALDLIFGFHGVSIVDGVCSTPTGSCNIGELPVFQWFHRQEHRAFNDNNGDGFWDPDEGPAALETGFNLRWRDGTIYQGNVSDGAGAYAFDQVFPFFSWLVAEVDFVRNKATGLTVVVDNGGPIDGTGGEEPPLDGLDWTFGRTINPQDQLNPVDPFCAANPTICLETDKYRIERGPVLTQGFQGFIGQTNAFLWGKQHYPDGENGGISGIVFYAVTRAENDPTYAVAEVWEPGIPGVTVNLYDATGSILLNTTTTDSWDASIPTGCKYGDSGAPYMFDPDGVGGIGPFPQDCWDGLRMFNQARPAVFDGGYAFDAVCADGMALDPDGNPFTDVDGNVLCSDGGVAPVGPMTVGEYVVQVIPPPGYEIIKPEDKNVDFGDEYNPVPELLPPPCVGTPTMVPPYLTLFPDQQIESPFVWQNGVYVGDQPANFRPLCDQKLVNLSAGANAAADFSLFTEVPVAAHALGFILDDTQNEFDPNSPNFGEKYAPPFVPVTIRDFTGRMIGKTLSDQYGLYNFLAPSTITANLPQPSGMSPNMLTTCMNDPGDDPNNPDSNWNQLYSTFCYTFQYMPGVTTYLDTPVVPVAAFTGPDQFPLDCEYPDGTPRIYSVSVNGGGPYMPTYSVTSGPQAGRGVFISGDQTITITSMGQEQVQNPEYCNPAAGVCPAGSDTVNKFVTRDFGFGATAGTVTLGDLGALNCTWGEPITCTVDAGTLVGPLLGPLGSMGGRQLTVTRDNGQETVAGVTVQVGLRQGSAVRNVAAGGSIQAAINAANANDLILVAPGQYNEIVVMWKPVQLQGWGEGSTTINAIKAPADKLEDWRLLVDSLITRGDIDLLPGQEVGLAAPEPTQLFTEEGAGVLVLAKASGNSRFDQGRNQGARIDGFTIRSADTGGGIIANGYTDYLQISNNRIANNSGFYGGGIRVGHPLLTDPDNLFYIDGDNDFVSIHHNQLVFNGGLGGAGGGISMCTGSDSYAVTENWVCGNFSTAGGGGIGHIGLSTSVPGQGSNPGGNIPLIADNKIIFNESFFQGQTVSGGGLFIGGAPPLTPGALSPGAGSVQALRNLIQGNSAGAGNGGGVSLASVGASSQVELFNNMIANNVAGLAAGGISVQNGSNVSIKNNTIANNDSLATAGEAFAPGSPNQSTPQPGAGVAVQGAAPTSFANNIIWHNRQFFFWVDDASGCTPGDSGCTSTYGICPDVSGGLTCPGGNTVVYDDLAGLTADGTNLVGTDPSFVREYLNGARSAVLQTEINTGIQTPAAFDEGGNFIRPGFGPLSLYDDPVVADGDPGTLFGDYHIQSGSPALNLGINGISPDFDGDPRPTTGASDSGADEL